MYFRFFQSLYKKYTSGHKLHMAPFEKAQTALKKQKKKNKNKFGFDQKELQVRHERLAALVKITVYSPDI